MKPSRIFLTLFIIAMTVGDAFPQDRGSNTVANLNLPHKKVAVLIGINKYKNLNPLNYAKNDVYLLRDSLYKIGFEKENVFCLTCDGTGENEPTCENILKTIQKAIDRTQKGDLLFIALSGHGVQLTQQQINGAGFTSRLTDMEKAREGENGERFWEARFAAIETENVNVERLAKTSISVPLIYDMVIKSRATDRLIMVDACREAATSIPIRSANSIPIKSFVLMPQPPRGIALIQSCSEGEYSYEDESLGQVGQGIFTYYIAEGISGKAAINGKVTLMGVFSYAFDKTTPAARKVAERLQKEYPDLKTTEQQPRMTSVDTLDIVLAEVPIAAVDLPLSYLAGNGMKFVRIEAGEFMMGDTLMPEEAVKKYPGGKLEWYEDAHPRHKVTISRPFYMGVYQVTVGEFRQFVNATGYQTTAEKEGTSFGIDKDGTWKYIEGLNWKNPGIEQTNRHPVVCVSWDDAQAFVDWMNKAHLPSEAWAKGWRYALPTEARWEYACRAGTTTDFFWGDTAEGGKGYLNAVGKEGAPTGQSWAYPFPFDDGYKATAPVGSYKPNNWGLYDMHGNVCEWCSDWYGPYPGGNVTDPAGASTGSPRVLRGGSWSLNAGNCRSADRSFFDPSFRCSYVGLRLSLVREN
ncbi:MAG: SUMF1/EgtB/PvdO family nonheme iron enzyme [Planctomycetaceae bacterium]|nr:SUMF1/EgtB/PvdO family nonheme iron enzyme [Planctomycetaceae bacterium]